MIPLILHLIASRQRLVSQYSMRTNGLRTVARREIKFEFENEENPWLWLCDDPVEWIANDWKWLSEENGSIIIRISSATMEAQQDPGLRRKIPIGGHEARLMPIDGDVSRRVPISDWEWMCTTATTRDVLNIIQTLNCIY